MTIAAAPVREDASAPAPKLRGIGWGLRLFIGGLLIYSGLLKAYDPMKFLDTLYKYELLGEMTGLLLAFALPALEMAIGALLIAGAGRVAGIAAVALFVVFIAAQASAWGRGLAIDCGCFGDSAPGGNLVGPWTMARTAILALMAGAIVVITPAAGGTVEAAEASS